MHLLVLLACAPTLPPLPRDQDGDGFVSTADCDDLADWINPAALDTGCDGVDDDCDGSPDDANGAARVWYADRDGDGFGDFETSEAGCAKPEGYVTDATDCDDADAERHPGRGCD